MARAIVYHGYYGCETGCCGHYVELDTKRSSNMKFDHPDSSSPQDMVKFVQRLVTEEYGEEHVADIDWDKCKVVDD